MIIYIKAYIIKKLIIKIEGEKIYQKKCTASYFSLIIMFINHYCHEEKIKN